VSHMSGPTPRAQDDAEHVALPYAEGSSPAEAYDDASLVAQTYPVVRLPHHEIADRMIGEARWQQICEEISSHGALERNYLD
jgi:hypothetical protein